MHAASAAPRGTVKTPPQHGTPGVTPATPRASIEVHAELQNHAHVALGILQIHRHPEPDRDRLAGMDPLHAGDAVVAKLAVLAGLEAQGDTFDRPHHRAAKAALARVECAERLDRLVAEVEAHRRHVATDAEISVNAD